MPRVRSNIDDAADTAPLDSGVDDGGDDTVGEPPADGDLPTGGPLAAAPLEPPPPPPEPQPPDPEGPEAVIPAALAENSQAIPERRSRLIDMATGQPPDPDTLFRLVYPHGRVMQARAQIVDVSRPAGRVDTVTRLVLQRGAHLSLDEAQRLLAVIHEQNPPAEPDGDEGEDPGDPGDPGGDGGE